MLHSSVSIAKSWFLMDFFFFLVVILRDCMIFHLGFFVHWGSPISLFCFFSFSPFGKVWLIIPSLPSFPFRYRLWTLLLWKAIFQVCCLWTMLWALRASLLLQCFQGGKEETNSIIPASLWLLGTSSLLATSSCPDLAWRRAGWWGTAMKACSPRFGFHWGCSFLLHIIYFIYK